MAAAGAWAKEGKSGKTLTFSYIILIGMPMSQTLYAMILMNQLGGLKPEVVSANAGLLFGIGLAGGLFHMLNNAIYKSALFLCAGVVEKEVGTTDLAYSGFNGYPPACNSRILS